MEVLGWLSGCPVGEPLPMDDAAPSASSASLGRLVSSLRTRQPVLALAAEVVLDLGADLFLTLPFDLVAVLGATSAAGEESIGSAGFSSLGELPQDANKPVIIAIKRKGVVVLYIGYQVCLGYR
jgi:hypothetical protein